MIYVEFVVWRCLSVWTTRHGEREGEVAGPLFQVTGEAIYFLLCFAGLSWRGAPFAFMYLFEPTAVTKARRTKDARRNAENRQRRFL